MKKLIIGLWLAMMPVLKLYAQSQEVQQLLLNVEKLAQLKQLLSDMKKGYQVVSTGYNSIKNLSEGNFSLHKTFLDGLMQVNPAIRKYHRVKQIIDYQIILVKEYKSAFNGFKKQKVFSSGELDYMGRVYSNLFKQSLHNMDELTAVVTADKLRMSDDERLKAIDRIYLDMQDKLLFLRGFNNSTSVLGSQRDREKREIEAMKGIYGISR